MKQKHYAAKIIINFYQVLAILSFMSRAKQSVQTPSKPKFNTKPYERPGLTESDILEIKEQFDLFDREHIGSINPKQLKSAIGSLGPEARNHSLYQLLTDLDGEGHGNITFEEFIHLMTPRLLESDSRENINKIFALFDDQKTGYIGVKSLRRVIHQLNLDLSEDDVTDLIKVADLDKDGQVSEEEFYNLITSHGRHD